MFIAVLLADDVAGREALTMLVAKYRVERPNLLVGAIPGLIPVALLAVTLVVLRRLAARPPPMTAIAWGGLLPIIAMLVWGHLQYWPLYLPERVAPGFPHGLELVIVPVVFAPVAMIVGVIAAWLIARR